MKKPIDLKDRRFQFSTVMGKDRFAVYYRHRGSWEYVGSVWKEEDGTWGAIYNAKEGVLDQGRTRQEAADILASAWLARRKL